MTDYARHLSPRAGRMPDGRKRRRHVFRDVMQGTRKSHRGGFRGPSPVPANGLITPADVKPVLGPGIGALDAQARQQRPAEELVAERSLAASPGREAAENALTDDEYPSLCSNMSRFVGLS
jgi:hypothetical protein